MKIKRSDIDKLVLQIIAENKEDKEFSDIPEYPIKTFQQANSFRLFVNRRYPKIAKKLDLDPRITSKSSIDNNVAREAWRQVGVAYIKTPQYRTLFKKPEKSSDGKKGAESIHKGGYIILGNNPSSDLIVRGLKLDPKSNIGKIAKNIPQGHGIAIIIEPDGKATGIEFGGYYQGECYKKGVNFGSIVGGRKKDLGDPKGWILNTFLKKVENQNEFIKYLNTLDEKHKKRYPDFPPESNPLNDIKKELAKLKKSSNRKYTKKIEKLFFKHGVKFFKAYYKEEMSGKSREEKKQLKKALQNILEPLKRQRSQVKRTTIGWFSPGTVLQYPLGSISISKSNITQAQTNSLVKKFKRAHDKFFSMTSSIPEYSVFKASDTAGALAFINKQKCKPYLILPNDISKYFGRSDNCGTFAYRVFKKAIGKKATIPFRLYKSPSQLLDSANSAGSDRFLFDEKLK